MKLSQAALVAIKPNHNLSAAGAEPPRNIEQARVAFLARRLRIAPHMAPLIARLAFGEARAR